MATGSFGTTEWVKKPKDKYFGNGPTFSISDPALAEFLGLAGVWGGNITEQQALGLTAVFRAQSLIAGTIASLPLKVYQDVNGDRECVDDHWLTDSPAGPYDITNFSWKEMLVLHLLNHAEGYLKAIKDGNGQLVGLWPVHPMAISRVRWNGSTKVFDVSMADGSTEESSPADPEHEMHQVLGLSLDGLRGMAPLALFRQSIQTSRAGELAANRQFTTGALIGGLVTTEEDVELEEAKSIKQQLNVKLAGAEHAGDIAFVNRSLKFTPWTMTNADAEFIASRTFQVEEVARMYGVPPHLLMATEKQTSWGTGVAEQNLALHRYTFMEKTSRIEAALNKILKPMGLMAAFDYHGLLQGSPADEINLLLAEIKGGLLTVDEARAIIDLPPMPETNIPMEPVEPAEPTAEMPEVEGESS